MYIFKSSFFFLMFVCLLSASLPELSAQESAGIDLLSHWWKFNTSATVQGNLNKVSPQGKFVTADPIKGFTIRFNVNLSKFEGKEKLLEIDNVVSATLRRVSPGVRDGQNYAAFRMADGSLPVIEAGIILYRDKNDLQGRKMIIGCPLAMLSNSYGKHEIILNFDGPRWTMYIDGELMDNDFPIGYPRWNPEAEWSVNPQFVDKAEIFAPGIKPERDVSHKAGKRPSVQYWTPEGHNSWVGDITTIYHNGRYHVFYLYDRRHHASKFGTGGHYFEHLSTTDFIHWTEHEAAIPIDEQWETFGTGTPFVLNDKLYITYGLHTSRLFPDEKNMYPVLKAYYDNNGKTGAFDYASFPTVPSGTTYSVSHDSISDFVKSGKIIHFSENPGIYVNPDGKLTMLASYRSKGMWQTGSLDGGWYCVNDSFPPGGDCTFFFRWGKFDYIIGGFVNLWMKPIEKAETEYKNMAASGDDFYNGFSVPSVTKISDGRFIMAAWLPVRGWGGPLLIHELLQYPDGRIGSKWMKELIPETDATETIAEKLDRQMFYNTKEKSFILAFDVLPSNVKDGKIAVSFLPSEGTDKGCEFQLRIGDLMAQYSNTSFDGYAPSEKSLRQGGQPQTAYNYAIEKLIGINKPFLVRMVVKYTDKLGGVLIDSEIAGRRTMITYRPDLSVNKLMFKSDGAKVKNIRIAPLK